MNYILYAIPVFALLIVIEIIYDRYKGTGFYRVNDAITSLNAGVLSRVHVIFRSLVPLTIYSLIVEHIALVQLSSDWVLWLIAFVLYDFCYYWHHRFGHEVNLFWAAHVVHHSSEDYNLSTALRQTSGSFFGFIFYIPIALLGIEPMMLLAVASLNLLYQFWVHTQHIPKLGWYEWIFVTPSNHRVHHATNQIYIDRNYGGVFIIWDRLFGSFQEELDDEPCMYGIRKPIKSWNPVWANLHFYTQLVRDAWHTKSWRDKCRIWFMPTGWRPADVEEKFPLPRFDPATFKKYNVQLPNRTRWYCLIQQVVLLLVTFLFMQSVSEFSVTEQLLWGGFIVYSAWSLGMLLEVRTWAIWSELVRYPMFIALTVSLSLPEWLALVTIFAVVIGLVALAYVAQKRRVSAA